MNPEDIAGALCPDCHTQLAVMEMENKLAIMQPELVDGEWKGEFDMLLAEMMICPTCNFMLVVPTGGP